jgi:hypothetical protein
MFGYLLGFMIIPGIDEYKKHKNTNKKEALKHAFIPLLYFIGLVIAGFILHEFLPHFLADIIEEIF